MIIQIASSSNTLYGLDNLGILWELLPVRYYNDSVNILSEAKWVKVVDSPKEGKTND